MIRKILAAALLLAGLGQQALAQSTPGLIRGQVPTAAQWNSFFAAKQDNLGYNPVNRAGDTMSGKLTVPVLNLIPGTAPAIPVNGDIWTTSAGLFARIGGVTIGPYFSGTRTFATGCGLAGGGDFTADRTLIASNIRNAQTGTTYAIVNGDCGKSLTFKNAAAVAVSMPTPAFADGWNVSVQNIGAGTVTITPVSPRTINDGVALTLTTGQGANIYSDGTNYIAQLGVGTAASGVTTFAGRTGAVVGQADDYKAFVGLATPYNCTLAASISAGTLTISIKDVAGADPSVSSPCLFGQRKAANNGAYDVIPITAAKSISFPFNVAGSGIGSTLGFQSSTAGRLWILACLDGSAVQQLAVFNARGQDNIFPLDESGLFTGAQDRFVSTGNTHSDPTIDGLSAGATDNLFVGMGVFGTNITGGTFITAITSSTAVTLNQTTAGSSAGTFTFYANAPGVLYTTTPPITNRPCRVMGNATWEGGAGAAGNWTVLPSLSLFGPAIKLPGSTMQTARLPPSGTQTSTPASTAYVPVTGVTKNITLKSAANGVSFAFFCSGQTTGNGANVVGVLQRGGVNVSDISSLYSAAGGFSNGNLVGFGSDFPGIVGPIGYGVFIANKAYPSGGFVGQAPANFGGTCSIMLEEIVQ